MEELSLHILDLVQNSLRAAATKVEIFIKEDLTRDCFLLEVRDNGRGMPEDFVKEALSPFTTTRTTRRVGLGLSLLDMVARRCGGGVEIDTKLGKGTRVRAVFQHSHWDRAPLGDIKATLVAIIAANPKLSLIYKHRLGGRDFILDTEEIKGILGRDIPLNNMAVLGWLEEYIAQGLAHLYGGEEKDGNPKESG
ncbi:MAG: ATP-binding protein [Firmicutes bacterium]|nr:ATP-binding protein [Bacillota bacterium]